MYVSIMNISSTSLMETLLLLWTVITLSGASVSRCPGGQYLDPDTHNCLACGTCPRNQIIRRPCSQHSNTICGPFFEFYEFHQAPRPTLDVDDLYQLGETEEGDDEWRVGTDLSDHGPGDSGNGDQPREKYASRGEPSKKKFAQRKNYSDLNDNEDPDFESSRAGEASAHEAWSRGTADPRFGQQSNRMPRLQTPDEEENQWKVLALALIIVLCVVCIVLIVFIFIICYLRSSRDHTKNALFSTAKGAGTGNEGHRSPVHHHYCHVPVYAHANGSTEANQSATTSPGQMEDPSDTNEADNSHMQAIPNSDYVYFRSPQNGNEAVDV